MADPQHYADPACDDQDRDPDDDPDDHASTAFLISRITSFIDGLQAGQTNTHTIRRDRSCTRTFELAGEPHNLHGPETVVTPTGRA